MSGEPPPGALPGNPPGPVAQPGGLPVQVDPAVGILSDMITD
jgi:hypothetical protein